MINNIIITPILFFSLVFSSLVLSFSLKKFLTDRVIFYFSNFLIVIWIFSLIELSNYFGVLPDFITNYLSSILLFLLHYFLLFQYLFVYSFLFKTKKIIRYLFMILFSLWAVYFSLPENAVGIIEGSDQIKQSIFSGISLLPALLLVISSVYHLFYQKLKISKILLSMIIAGLVLPIFVIFQVINVQPDSFTFSLDIIFLSLSISMYFYTLLLYLSKDRNFLGSFRDKVTLITTMLVVIPLILRSTYVYSSSRDILNANIISTIEEENQYHTYNILSSFQKHIKGVNILSQFDDLSQIEGNPIAREKTEAVFINYLKNNSGVSKISVMDIFGNEKLRVEQLNEEQSVISSEELIQIKSPTDLKFPLENEENFLFISKINSTETQQTIEFSSPIFYSNEIVGLVLMSVDVQEIFSYFIAHDTTHNQYIVDSSGNYLYNYGLEKVMNHSNIKDDFDEVWQTIQTGDTNSVIIGKNKNQKIFTYKKIAINFGELSNVFYVIHEENIDIAFSDLNHLSFILVGTMIILTLITFVLVYIVTSYLIKPFINLIDSIKNYDYVDKNVFENHSSKEVEDLSRAFLNMINKVKESKFQISKQVEHQTEQISENSGRLEKQRAAMINLIEDIDAQRKLNFIQATDLKKFKLAIDSVSELIVITDTQGMVIYVNPAVKALTGFTVQDSIGSKAGKLWGGVMSKEWYEKFWHIIADRKETFVDQITNKKKNGEKFIAQITVQPLLDDIGNIQHYVSVQRDITEQIKVDRMKTDFISLASHQLRTPLSAMKWFLEMMKNGDLGELNQEQMDAVKNIDASNTRMITLVNALLNISRIESGRIIVNPVEANIVDLVKTTIVSVKKKFDDKQQSISFRADTSLPKISLDKDLVSQVVINLLTNANKYTNNGGSVSVSIKQAEGFVLVNISDNGIGIPQNEKENVFKRFYRATNIVKKVTDGTGLGLYLAKAIVETLGGQIGLESEEGKGSNFWFTIPLSGVDKKEGEVSIALTKN